MLHELKKNGSQEPKFEMDEESDLIRFVVCSIMSKREPEKTYSFLANVECRTR